MPIPHHATVARPHNHARPNCLFCCTTPGPPCMLPSWFHTPFIHLPRTFSRPFPHHAERGLTGTKLGCGEGGCGACTVMVSSWQGGRVQHRAVNACLCPMYAVEGCHVVTVEGAWLGPLPYAQWAYMGDCTVYRVTVGCVCWGLLTCAGLDPPWVSQHICHTQCVWHSHTNYAAVSENAATTHLCHYLTTPQLLLLLQASAACAGACTPCRQRWPAAMAASVASARLAL